MKKILSVILAAIILVTGGVASAIPYDFRGGVANEIVYSEYVFLSGMPVKFTGTYTATQTIRKNRNVLVDAYTFNLASEDPNHPGTLVRSVTFTTTLSNVNEVKQYVGKTELSSFAETVVIDGVTYNLDHYFFSKSDNVDRVPASDFYKSTLKTRRIYSVNGNVGTVTIDTTGGTTGYYNMFGNSETIKLEESITQKINTPAAGTTGTGATGGTTGGTTGTGTGTGTATPALKSWTGGYTVNVADSNTISLQYDKNEGNFSSFAGNINKVEKYETISKYTYMLPAGKGEVSLRNTKMPKVEALIAAKFRDVEGIPSEDAITKLYALNIMSDTGGDKFAPTTKTVTNDTTDLFHPAVRLTRVDFIRAFINACSMRYGIQIEPSALQIVIDADRTYNHLNEDRNEQKGIYALNYENYFLDVKDYHPDFELIENGVEIGVIKGRRRTRFRPDEYITKAEVATFMARAIGMENRAPNPSYYTDYTDDDKIGDWARDSIYAMTVLEIFGPDEDGNFNPSSTMTRAEGAEYLIRFVEMLDQDIKDDYKSLVEY